MLRSARTQRSAARRARTQDALPAVCGDWRLVRPALQSLLGPPQQRSCDPRANHLSPRVSTAKAALARIGLACRRNRVERIFHRSGSAVIGPVTTVAAPTISAAPVRTSIRAVSSPPGRAPVHTRPTDRSPAATPIAASPHWRTGWDDRPGNDGHGGRCDRRGRRFRCRWRGRDLKVRRMSRHERRRHERQCGDNREKALTQDILQWATVNTTQNPNGGSLVSRLLGPAGSLSVYPVD